MIWRRWPVNRRRERIGVRGGAQQNPAAELLALRRGAVGQRGCPENVGMGLDRRVGDHLRLGRELDP